METTGTSISSETGKTIPSISQLTMFNVLRDIDTNTKLLNIWKSYTVKNSILTTISYYDVYLVEAEDWWDNIAFKIYGDVQYWWVIALFNNVINPFEELTPGTSLKILKKNYLFQLLREIQGIASL